MYDVCERLKKKHSIIFCKLEILSKLQWYILVDSSKEEGDIRNFTVKSHLVGHLLQEI